MAATVKGITTLVFGTDTVSGVIMQDLDSELTGQVTEVTDEQDSVVAFALHHIERADVSGTYVYKGSDIVTSLGTALTLTNAVGSGGTYVYTYGRKQTHNGFMTGSFKAIRVQGIS